MILIVALCLLCGCVAPRACRSVDTRESPSEDLEPFVSHHHHEGNIAELLIPLLERSLTQTEGSGERQHRRLKPGKKVIQVLPYRGTEEHKRKGWRKLNSRKKQVVEITPLHGKNGAKPLAYILSAAKPSHGDAERNDDASSMSTSDLEQDKLSNEEEQSSEDLRQSFQNGDISVNVHRTEADFSSSSSLESSENSSSKQYRDESESESDVTKRTQEESRTSSDVTKEIKSRTAKKRIVIDSADDSIAQFEDATFEENAVTVEKIDDVTDEDAVIAETTDIVTEEDFVAPERADDLSEEDIVAAESTEKVNDEDDVVAERSDYDTGEDATTAERTENVTSEDAVRIDHVADGDAITVEKSDNVYEEDAVTVEPIDNVTNEDYVTAEKTDSFTFEDEFSARSHNIHSSDVTEINSLTDNVTKESEESEDSPQNNRKSIIDNGIATRRGQHEVESAEKTFSKLFNSQTRDIIELIQSSVEAITTPHRDCTSDQTEHNNHDHKSYRLSFLFNK